MIQTIIFLSIFVFVIAFFILLNHYTNQKYYNPVLLNFEIKGSHYGNADNGYIIDPKYLETGVKLPLGKSKQTKMPEFSDKLEATYLMSIFIENNFEMEDSDVERCIITRNDSPGFYYRPSNNSFIIKIKHGNSNATAEIEFSNLIQQQTWMQLACVFSNRNLDVYSNGKLHSSVEIENVPRPDSAPLVLFPNNGLYAKASYIHYFNKALEPAKIYLLSGQSCKPYWWLIA